MNALSLRSMFAVVLCCAGTVAAQTLVARSADALPDAPSFARQQAGATPLATGVVRGTVTDVHGGLVPGASIQLERTGESAVLEAKTDEAGHFALLQVPPGTYTLLIAAPELKSYLSTPFILHPGEVLDMPAVALAIATATTSVEVSANSPEVAEQELHLEEQQRVFGVLPNFFTSYVWNAAPLTTMQKFKLSVHASTDPVSFIGFALVAYIETSNDTFPSWGRDAPSYGKRFGAAFGDALISRQLDSALFPAIFHQDPRYFYMGPAQPGKKRLWHALSSGLIARGDNGRTQINYSHLVGNAGAGALSSFYHPASDGPGTLAVDNMLLRIGADAAQAFVREFVLDHLHHNKPSYANGEPPVAK
jgi:hypothetical protein